MYDHPSQMEPLFPARIEALADLAREVVAASARLEARLAPPTLAGVANLLRIINSYYSNLIENHNTHPVDIERAMRRDYSRDGEKRDLQVESNIHIEVQHEIHVRLTQEPNLNVASQEFLLWIHERFYHRLPERLRWVKAQPDTGDKTVQGEKVKRAWVTAGELRTRFVQVGNHVAPAPDALDGFLSRFAEAYHPARQHGLEPLIAIAAAHHRLMWIHPFLDGNGRVVRLFTDAYFHQANIAGYELWNVSRGLARRRDEYRLHLAEADSPRTNDLDGRGNLSNRALESFCRFFLETCLDQARFMDGLLSLNNLLERLTAYTELRRTGAAKDRNGATSPLRLETAKVLRACAIHGDIPRGQVVALIGMSERTGRNTLKALLDENLLLSDSPHGNVRLGFPTHAAAYWFPALYPVLSAT